MGYILVDFDRTLAQYSSWEEQKDEVGDPVPAMLERVQRWLHAGKDVRIFTARVAKPGVLASVERDKVEGWCKLHLGRVLPVQNWKDHECEAIWDDLAMSVEQNTGWRTTYDAKGDPLETHEEYELAAHPADVDERFTEDPQATD